MTQKINVVSKDDYIYANPITKKGRETYVHFDKSGNGWCFNTGQAWSTRKFHPDINTAINEMRECADIITGKKKINNGIFIVNTQVA
jgi:hypothetical protein